MKWKNKGHEFDEVYEKICEKKNFYLFGAGDYGTQFYGMFKNDINIVGFVDNNKSNKDVKYGLHVYRLKDIVITEEIGIIITAGQFQRISIVDELKNKGLEKGINYFVLEEFMAVYFVYKYNKVYLSTISYLPSTICNLKCEACLNFNPYADKFYTRPIDKIKEDIDLFFKHVDKVMTFHVSGGEPMLYPNIGEVIEYLDNNYGDRIHTFRTVTNGTVVPSDELLKTLSKCNIEVTVDDYREAVPQYKEKFEILLGKLVDYKVKFYIFKVDNWIDLAPLQTDYFDWNEEQLEIHFDMCCQSWNEFRDGKIFSCNYDGYATVAGINEIQKEEIYDLTQHTVEKNKELVEFRLGYNSKGYTNLCKHCRGFNSNNTINVPVARQIR